MVFAACIYRVIAWAHKLTLWVLSLWVQRRGEVSAPSAVDVAVGKGEETADRLEVDGRELPVCLQEEEEAIWAGDACKNCARARPNDTNARKRTETHMRSPAIVLVLLLLLLLLLVLLLLLLLLRLRLRLRLLRLLLLLAC